MIDPQLTEPLVRQDATQQIIKYMGSKARLLDFIVDGINEVYSGDGVCDLFAGSAILSGAIGRSVPVYSNDIQNYSAVLAGYYLTAWSDNPPTASELIAAASELVEQHRGEISGGCSYADGMSLNQFNSVEARNRELIESSFTHDYHLFVKNYAGTWWSAEQCLWIDAIRQVADRYQDTPSFNLIMAALLHAMAYCGSGTGHYAQYRDATSESSLRDISIYRQRSFPDYFTRKYESLAEALQAEPPSLNHEITALDYRDRLASLSPCTVYADPPYAFVHYSRFYHAIETVCLYDFPELQIQRGNLVKGRYREGRHQSPFCIRTKVAGAFQELFHGVAQSVSHLVLSYSNTGMMTRDDLIELARQTLPNCYTVRAKTMDHKHMTMGRKADRDRDIEEVLIIAQRT